MREVALDDAKNGLSALIQEIAQTGEEILITRHGKRAARLTPVTRSRTPKVRREALERLRALQEKLAAENRATAPLDWETLKRQARNEDKGGLP